MAKDTGVIVGLDVSDRFSSYCMLDAASGEVVEEGKVATRAAALSSRFDAGTPLRVVLETGTHATWIARLLRALGHEVLVADARRLRFIYASERKDDEIDARMLAKVGRLDPSLLHPVRTRSPETDAGLAVLRSRDVLVEARTKLVNSLRGQLKRMGRALPRVSSDAFAAKARERLPEELLPVFGPLLDSIAALAAQIRVYDGLIEELCAARPETGRLRQVKGVGPVTSLAYVLVIDDPSLFAKSRHVGPYLGLVPRREQSGDTDKQLRVTRAGDKLLRKLLVNSAHYVLGPFGPDTDLRRWGLSRAARGGAQGKKRAVVAVARRLAVLLHRLWVGGEDYRPLKEASAAA
jgi:transposase